MAILYLSAWEYVREKPFEVYAPAYYHPVVPESVLSPRQELEKVNTRRMVSTRRRPPPHLFQPHDPHQMQRCAYSIWIMLDMFQKGVEFALAIESEIVDILDNLDRYLLTIKEDVEAGDERLTGQAELIVRWRAEVYKHYYRYMMNNPEAKERLYPNQSATQNVFHLMNLASGGGARAQELDPLRAKGNPPYNVEKIKPREQTPQDLDDNFIGLPTAGVSLDDDGSFSMDDFLKKGS